MAKINWDSLDDRRFRAGVDRVVFYPHKQGYSGVPWRGVINVTGSEEGALAEPVYIDGFAVVYDFVPGDYVGTIEAFSKPDEFSSLANGEMELSYGLSATGQERNTFDLCYREKQGSALDTTMNDYIIHLVYNALAIQDQESLSTVSDSNDPASYTWTFFCVPTEEEGDFRPVSHFKVDSKKVHPALMSAVEGLLYGYEVGSDPRMPSISEIQNIIESEPGTVFTNHATNPSFETLQSWTSFGVFLTRSTQWSSTGTYSLEVKPTTAGVNSYICVGAENSVSTFGSNVWLFGAVKMCIMEPINPNSASSFARRMVVVLRDSDNNEQRFMSNAAQTSPGVYTLMLEPMFIPSGTSYLSVQLWNGKDNSNPAVFLDDLILVTASNTEKDTKWGEFKRIPNLYFDGNSRHSKWGYGAWVGAENNSKSVYHSFGL